MHVHGQSPIQGPNFEATTAVGAPNPTQPLVQTPEVQALVLLKEFHNNLLANTQSLLQADIDIEGRATQAKLGLVLSGLVIGISVLALVALNPITPVIVVVVLLNAAFAGGVIGAPLRKRHKFTVEKQSLEAQLYFFSSRIHEILHKLGMKLKEYDSVDAVLSGGSIHQKSQKEQVQFHLSMIHQHLKDLRNCRIESARDAILANIITSLRSLAAVRSR